MQNKGLINFFAIILTLVSLYYISFTFVGNSIKNDAKAFAKGDFQKEQTYLDSIAKEKVFLGLFTYDEVRDKEIKKGLDLEGGINIILEISVKDILKGLANQSNHPVFNKALEDAKANQQGNETYLNAFFRNFKSLSNGNVRLAAPEIFANRNFEEVRFDMSDSQVESILKTKVNETVVSAFEVLRKRIDQFGVTQPNIQQLGESGRILIELPGAKDVDRVKKLVGGTAQLEFWETYKFDEVAYYFQQVDDLSKVLDKEASSTKEVVVSATDTLNQLISESKSDDLQVASPFQKVFNFYGGSIVGASKDTAAVNKFINSPQAMAARPANLKYMKLAWGKPTINKETGETFYELYALKANKENKAPLSGGVIVDASDSFDQMGKPAVSMQMNGEGAKAWEKLTGIVHANQNAIAIVLDDIVYSAPGVTTGAISGGRSEITGNFTLLETKDLANVLKAGKLPAKADIVQSDVVGPSLGKEAIQSGFMSFGLGLLLVLGWMILYYGKAGLFANISLVVNIVLLFGLLISLGAVLTLPGIAGVILTIGMAVDANVILFERAKEGLNAGKTIDEAVGEAYTFKGGLSSIFDANITTLLTAIILYVFGTGPIKGFATTLMIGIFTSVFTAIFVSKYLIDRSLANKSNLTFNTELSKNWFKNINIDFMSKKKIAYAISTVLILISLAGLFTIGLNKGIDFEGGRTFQVRFPSSVTASEVSKSLTDKFGVNVEAKTFGNDNQLKISTKYKVAEEGVDVDLEVNNLLFEGLKPYYDATYNYEDFATNDDDKTIGLMQSTKVGPTIAEDIKRDSFWAVLGSLLVVFLYILIRFRKYQYSLGAVAAVFHDVILVLGLFAFGWKFLPINMEVDQAFIAAILTVIGYSLNDTVIIFDRIRENLGLNDNKLTKTLVNNSLSSTLSRTINTSMTTLIVLLTIFLLGGETIRGFIFAILVGIIVGTYSSLFVASPIMYDTLKKSGGQAE